MALASIERLTHRDRVRPSIPTFFGESSPNRNTKQSQAEGLIGASLKLAEIDSPFPAQLIANAVQRAIIDAHHFPLTGISSLSEATASLNDSLIDQEGMGRTDYYPEPATHLLIKLLAGAIPFSNHYLSNPISTNEYYNVSWAMRRTWEMKDRKNLDYSEGKPYELTFNISDYVNKPVWDALTVAVPNGRSWYERRTEAFNEDCIKARRALTNQGLWNINTEFFRNLRTELSNSDDTTGYQIAILEELENRKWREVGDVVLDTIVESDLMIEDIAKLYETDLLVSICNEASKKLREKNLITNDSHTDILLLVLSAINVLSETKAYNDSLKDSVHIEKIEPAETSAQMQNLWGKLVGNPDNLSPEKWGKLSESALDAIRAVYLQNHSELGNPADFAWASEHFHNLVINPQPGENQIKPWENDHKSPYWDLPYHMRYNYVLLLSTASLQFHKENIMKLENKDVHNLTKTWIKALWRSVEKDYRASFDFDLATDYAVDAMNTVLGTEAVLIDINHNDFDRLCDKIHENIKTVQLWKANNPDHQRYLNDKVYSRTFDQLENDMHSNAKNNVALIALAAMNARVRTESLAESLAVAA